MKANSLKDLADRIGFLFKNEAKDLRGESRIVKIILLVGGGVAAGVAQFIESSHSWPEWMGIGGVIAMAVGGFIGTLREQTTIEALEEARQALEVARTAETSYLYVQNYIGDLEDKLRRMAHLHTAQFSMREAVEQCINLPKKDEAGATEKVLASAKTLLRAAMDFQMDEQWTVSVYHAQQGNDGKVELACVAADRFDQRSADQTRRWPIGVGHTGSTYAKGDETVVPDLAALQLGTLDRLPNLYSHETDSQRYRSIAAVPINVLNDPTPWGVVVATSDRPNKFTLDHDQKGSLNAEVVRAFAGVMALAVATQRQG